MAFLAPHPLSHTNLRASCMASARFFAVMSKDEASEHTPSTLWASSKISTASSQRTSGVARYGSVANVECMERWRHEGFLHSFEGQHCILSAHLKHHKSVEECGMCGDAWGIEYWLCLSVKY